MTGPVQVLVVGFEQPRFSGEVLAELARLREAGVVRLLDLLVVTRTQEGLELVDIAEQLPETGASLGSAAAALLAEPPDADTSSGPSGPTGPDDGDDPGVAATFTLETIPVGTTAAVALLEHTWAVPLTQAVRRAGGVTLDETWLDPDDAAALASLLDGLR